MARIPELGGGKSRLSMDVQATPTRPIGQVGIVEDAKAKMASQIGDLAVAIGKKRTLAKAQNFLSANHSEMVIKYNTETAKLKTQFSGDHEGYSKAVEDMVNKDIDERKQNAPSAAGEDFIDRALTLKSSAISQALNYEKEKAAKFYDEDMKTQNDDLSLNSYMSPDIERDRDLIRQREIDIDSGVGIKWNKDKAENYKQDMRKKILLGNIYGLRNMKEFKSAEALLNNFGGMLGPEEKDKQLKLLGEHYVATMNTKLSKQDSSIREDEENYFNDELNSMEDILKKVEAGEDPTDLLPEASRKFGLDVKDVMKIKSDLMQREDNEASKEIEVMYNFRLEEEDPNAVYQSLKGDNSISAASKLRVIALIRSKKKENKTGNKQNTLARNFLKKALEAPPLMKRFGSGAYAQMQLQASNEMEELFEKNPNADLMKLAKKIVGKYVGELENIEIIPGINPIMQKDVNTLLDPKNISTMGNQLYSMYQNKRYTFEEYKKYQLILKQLHNAAKAKKEAENVDVELNKGEK